MMFIPPGSYILGQIDAVTKPGWRTPRALFQMHFSKIIFANGYTLELAEAPAQAATATVHVEVSSRNDVLLDNGAQFDMVVETPLTRMPAKSEKRRAARDRRLSGPRLLYVARFPRHRARRIRLSQERQAHPEPQTS